MSPADSRSLEGRIVPVKVPWKASGFLRFFACEHANEPTHAVFVADFDRERIFRRSSGMKVSVGSPPQFEPVERPVADPKRLVRVVFEGVLASRMHCLLDYCDDEEFDLPNHFDQSACFWGGRIVEDPQKYFHEFYRYWQETGFCPDPRMYEVHDSLWMRQVDYARDPTSKHYAICSHDASVEVIAEKWTWEQGQGVDDHW